MAVKRLSAREKRLIQDLTDILPSLDEEGLSFLLEQAEVHRYNMEVTRLNDAREKREKVMSKGKPAKSAATREGKSIRADFRVERSPSGSSYHIISGGKWKMFSDAEMIAMVKIAQAKVTQAEAGEHLYEWFDRERSDVFKDLELGKKGSAEYVDLVKMLRKKFSLRK